MFVVLSHHIPEVAEHVYYYRVKGSDVGTQIASNQFFDRPLEKPSTPNVMSRHANDYYDRGGKMTRLVRLTPTTFERVKYYPEQGDITNIIAGAPAPAFIEAITQWLNSVESGMHETITNPMSNLLAMRSVVKSFATGSR